jgi:hypothetical protein
MEPYNALKQLVAPIFERSGHKQISEQIQPEVFGSAHSVFDNQRSKIRIVWDGRDAWGIAQLFSSDVASKWEDIGDPLAKRDLENAGSDPNVQRFLAAIEKVAT